MVFLIVLVCYLSWTIPATFGLFDPPSAASSSTILQNDNTSLLNQTDSLIVSIITRYSFFLNLNYMPIYKVLYCNEINYDS